MDDDLFQQDSIFEGAAGYDDGLGADFSQTAADGPQPNDGRTPSLLLADVWDGTGWRRLPPSEQLANNAWTWTGTTAWLWSGAAHAVSKVISMVSE